VIVFKPTPTFAASHPAHMIAFGFGAGLAPFAPGTFGTLLAWPIGWFFADAYPPNLPLFFIALFFLVGIWACGVTGRRLGVHDHGGMVWDEFVAFLLVLTIVPRSFAWQLAAFVAFRFFDIVKPPPIRQLDRSLHGGLGIMLDDFVAGVYAATVIGIARWML
jgi:phosphatidylglycerophosphatase A